MTQSQWEQEQRRYHLKRKAREVRKARKRDDHTQCDTNPCMECHTAFLDALAPLVNAFDALAIAMKKAGDRKCKAARRQKARW